MRTTYGASPALRWMENETQPPRGRDQTALDGGAKLGRFWDNCKSQKRCVKSPYDRLLANPVLKADYVYYRHPVS